MVPVTSPLYRLGKEPPNKGRRFPVEVLTREEAGRLIAACSHRAPSGVRNRALIVVMWRGGLRCGEATGLLPKDVDAAAGTVTVLRGKGAKRRVVGLDPQAMVMVERWRELRTRLAINGRAPLFCTIRQGVRGGPLNTAYVREMVAERAAKAGIEKRVHPHALRHTNAYELSQEGVPVELIRRHLGHTSLATTQRYIDHVAPFELIRAMHGRSWT